MYKIAIVLLAGIVLLQGQPNLAELLRKYVEMRIELADMRQTVCPD